VERAGKELHGRPSRRAAQAYAAPLREDLLRRQARQLEHLRSPEARIEVKHDHRGERGVARDRATCAGYGGSHLRLPRGGDRVNRDWPTWRRRAPRTAALAHSPARFLPPSLAGPSACCSRGRAATGGSPRPRAQPELPAAWPSASQPARPLLPRPLARAAAGAWRPAASRQLAQRLLLAAGCAPPPRCATDRHGHDESRRCAEASSPGRP
jgi:hypothetical protein